MIKKDENYKELLSGNLKYAKDKSIKNPTFFKELAEGQAPKYLWIGCSDSRIPVNEITNSSEGDIFVHRNIANLVSPTDFNFLSVLQYAVEHLKVEHIIVCGHYGCSGVAAAMTNNSYGVINNWLRNLKDTYHNNSSALLKIKNIEQRSNKLSELNVLEQVKNLTKTKTVQKAWQERDLKIHAWVYDIKTGKIKELAKPTIILAKQDIIYKIH